MDTLISPTLSSLRDVPPMGKEQNGKLIVHCGGTRVNWDELRATPTPDATATHFPIAHHQLVETTRASLAAMGYEISHASHATNKDGAHYFGLLGLKPTRPDAEYGFVIGLRNAHDKSISARMALGSNVFVCDNLSFSGEVELARKHTRHMWSQLPSQISGLLGQLHDLHTHYDQRVEAYRGTVLTDDEAKARIIDLARVGAIAGTRVVDVWDQWEKPPHAEFEPRNYWSLFNSVTEVMKSLQSPGSLVTRTRRLHAACDGWTGVLSHTLERDLVAIEA